MELKALNKILLLQNQLKVRLTVRVVIKPLNKLDSEQRDQIPQSKFNQDLKEMH